MNNALASVALRGAKARVWADGTHFQAATAQSAPLRLFRRAKRRQQNIDGFSMGLWTTMVFIHLDRTDVPEEPKTGDTFTLDGPFGLEEWRVAERAAGETHMGGMLWRVPVEPVPGTAAVTFMDGTVE